MKTTSNFFKYFLIALGMSILSGPVFAQKIFSCESKYEADFKVFVVDSKYEADLCVYKVQSKYEAEDNKGLWYFVESKYEADKKIYFTDSKYDADLLIYVVDSKYEAEWRERQKMHLLF